MGELIHPEPQKASTLPSRYYTDPGSHRRIADRIFARSWQWAGDDLDLRAPGSVRPFTLLEGTLDEPLVLTRDRDDSLHCLSNVCTHRGALVCEGAGNQNSLRCRYHGRRFGLDGSFQFMPEFDEVEDFPSEADNLPQIELERWRQFCFVRLIPEGPPLAEMLAEVERRCGWMPIEEFVFDPSRAKDYMVRANWMLYIDNYLEGFHIPYIHADLNATLDYGSYRTELFSGGNLQLGVAADDEEVFDREDDGHRVAAYYFWLFPNLMLNFYPWGLSVNVIKPLGPDRTRVSFLPYVWDESKIGDGAGAALDRVEREDEVVVESVQQGLRSRFYDRGRYSPEREKGVHQFHQMVAEALGDQ